MNSNPKNDLPAERLHTRWFIGLGALSLLVYVIISWLSWSFGEEVPEPQRPTLWMLSLFALAFVAYWAALALVLKLPPSRRLVVGIVAAACAFRGAMLPSVPIHEIDIYRYIWDGAVFAHGISPYEFAPLNVLEASEQNAPDAEEKLRQLVALQADNESLGYLLERIHYAQYPSPYPIVSQGVFGLAAKVTPDWASPHRRVVIMKMLLVAFDLATMLVVIGLLTTLGRHPGWSIAYGWCPLVLKEFANGGHLDSIAIFFTTLAIWLLVKMSRAKWRRRPLLPTALTAVVLALAIGAKLYPLVLVPLFAAVWWQRGRWKAALLGLTVATLCTAVLLRPMMSSGTPPVQPSDDETVALSAPAATTTDPGDGIRAFFQEWEMNDLAFMVIVENLRSQADVEPHERPWFVIVPDAWSASVVTQFNSVVNWLQNLTPFEEKEGSTDPADIDPEIRQGSFLLTRLITGLVTLFIALWLAFRVTAQKMGPEAYCRAAMLTLAWFWLLCPTQNPWYWCWVLPLLPFARYRTWHLVAACSLLYYLRFWFSSHFPEPPPVGNSLLGTPYDGDHFFYFVVAWVEFGVVFLGLAVEWCLRNRCRKVARVGVRLER